MYKLGLEKAKEAEIKFPTPVESSKKQESSRKKTSISAVLTTPKPLCRSKNNCGNSSRDGNTRPPYLASASWELYMQVKKQQLELDMGQQTDSK